MKRRLLGTLMAAGLLAALMPGVALADPPEVLNSGRCIALSHEFWVDPSLGYAPITQNKNGDRSPAYSAAALEGNGAWAGDFPFGACYVASGA